jgi:hypothetical protein
MIWLGFSDIRGVLTIGALIDYLLL